MLVAVNSDAKFVSFMQNRTLRNTLDVSTPSHFFDELGRRQVRPRCRRELRTLSWASVFESRMGIPDACRKQTLSLEGIARGLESAF